MNFFFQNICSHTLPNNDVQNIPTKIILPGIERNFCLLDLEKEDFSGTSQHGKNLMKFLHVFQKQFMVLTFSCFSPTLLYTTVVSLLEPDGQFPLQPLLA